MSDKPAYIKCLKCGHRWEFCRIPIDARVFCKLISRAVCPKCGEIKRLTVPGTDA